MSDYGIPFEYSPDDYKQCLEDTEKRLRDVIYNEMSKNYSTSWETNPKYGWNKEKISILAQRMKESVRTKDEKIRLIDFCDLLDLKKIIEINQNVLETIIPKKIAEQIDKLNSLRIPSAHSRELLPHQKNQIIAICGEILILIQEKQIGLGSSITNYNCELKIESVPADKVSDSMDAEVIRKKNTWISNIASLGKLDLKSEDDNYIEYLLRGSKGHAKIILGKKIHRQSSSQDWKAINISISTQSSQLLDNMILKGGIPFRVLYWTTNSKLDVNSLVHSIKEETGKGPGSSASNGVSITNATYGLGDFDGSIIRVLLTTENSFGKIGIQCDGGPGTGFPRIDTQFTPDLLISILLGKIPYRKIRQFISDSI